jgi:hypothetical protein
LENDLISLLKTIYHENHKVDKIIKRTQITLKAKFERYEGSFTLLEKVTWLVRSGICYRRNKVNHNDSEILDMDTLESLMFNFGKFYSESEIKIALDNLGDTRSISPQTLADFLADDVFEIEGLTTLTEYELPKKSRKSITMDRISRQRSRSRISSVVRNDSVDYQDTHGRHESPVKRSNLSSRALSVHNTSSRDRR